MAYQGIPVPAVRRPIINADLLPGELYWCEKELKVVTFGGVYETRVERCCLVGHACWMEARDCGRRVYGKDWKLNIQHHKPVIY